MLKKIIFSLLASLVLMFSFAPYLQVSAAPTASTAPTWYNQGFGDWFLKVNDQSNPNEIFGERYTAAQVQWVVYGFWAFIINTALGPKLGGVVACALGSAGQNQTLGSCLGPAFTNLFSQTNIYNNLAGSNQSLISKILADRPLSGITYTKQFFQKFSLVPVAHAQVVGFGFTSLNPIQKIWSQVRDFAFGLFVIVAIVFAFMIMFRVKISPQVVITVQSAIPKIIIALILVTFSYAIAGFLIDLMYVVIGLISLFLAPIIPQLATIPGTSIGIQPHTFTPPDVFDILTAGKVAGQLPIGGVFSLLIVYLAPWILLALLIILVLSFTPIGASGIGLILLWVPFIILIILIVWISIKIIFALFKAFTNIILLTIFAPLQITAGVVIPNFGFGQWLKSYISNLAVFVVTGVLWLLSWIFGLLAWRGLDFSGNRLVPTAPAVGNWPPILGSSDLGYTFLFAGVSFVMFSLIPKATEVIQGFMSGRPFAYGTAIGEAFGPVRGAYGFVQRPVTEGVVGAGATELMARMNLNRRPEDWRRIIYDFLNSLQQKPPPPGGRGGRYTAER